MIVTSQYLAGASVELARAIIAVPESCNLAKAMGESSKGRSEEIFTGYMVEKIQNICHEEICGIFAAPFLFRSAKAFCTLG